MTPSKSGVWQRFSVTEGTARFNDDAGFNPDVPWQDVIHVMDLCKKEKLERIEFAAPFEMMKSGGSKN